LKEAQKHVARRRGREDPPASLGGSGVIERVLKESSAPRLVRTKSRVPYVARHAAAGNSGHSEYGSGVSIEGSGLPECGY